MQASAYTNKFYDTHRGGSRRSAQVVVPIVLQLVKAKAVVDVGCGVGTWLSVFRELGVSDTVGLDGDYVDRRMLQIPQDQFRATDLSSPFGLSRTFDLAVSLEVAEHLPQQAAEGFVASLARLAPVVLFSAAIPFQSGTLHLNEQWPDYWAALFRRHDYVPIDCIRDKIWDNDDVEWWYAQNCLVFASTSSFKHNGALRTAFETTNPRPLNLVHPRLHLSCARSLADPQYGVTTALGILARLLKRATQRRLQRALPGLWQQNEN
jgi:SAM-dependent methyltransferase